MAAVLVVAGGGGGWLALKHSTLGRRADLASGYVARVVCSCRYLGNRDMKSCATDFEPGMEIVKMSDDPAAKRVTAWVPLLAKRSRRTRPNLAARSIRARRRAPPVPPTEPMMSGPADRPPPPNARSSGRSSPAAGCSRHSTSA